MSKVKVESDSFIRVRGRRQYDHLERYAVASAKNKIEMIERVMTLVSQEVQEILFPDLLSSGEYVVFWERVFSEHLRKRFVSSVVHLHFICSFGRAGQEANVSNSYSAPF